MSDLERAIAAEVQAFRPEQTPPFSVVLDRRRASVRRRTALVVAAGAAAALVVVPVVWWAGSGGDQLVQEAGPPGAQPQAAFSVHQVVEAAAREAATGSLQTPVADGAAVFPGGYSCGAPAGTGVAPDGGLVVCTGDGLGEAEILRLAPAAMTSDAVRAASAEPSPAGSYWEIVVELTPDGSRAFQELTGTAACAAFGDPGRRIALVVDGVALGVPLVAENVICDEGIASASVQLVVPDATEAQAQELARRLAPG